MGGTLRIGHLIKTEDLIDLKMALENFVIWNLMIAEKY